MSDNMTPMVGVVMGSQSDWATMKHATLTLDKLGIGHDARVISAHRTPSGATLALLRARLPRCCCRHCRRTTGHRSTV